MGNGIARQGDLGSHANILSQGASKTMEMNRPVHRFLDMFICPIHGIGVTMTRTAARVIVENRQVAFVGSVGIDKIPATIVQGSVKTFVGET